MQLPCGSLHPVFWPSGMGGRAGVKLSKPFDRIRRAAALEAPSKQSQMLKLRHKGSRCSSCTKRVFSKQLYERWPNLGMFAGIITCHI